MQSCKSCPSFVPANEVAVHFGKNIGVPACKRYGYALGRPGLSAVGEDALQESFALTCDSFGAPAPTKPNEVLPRVVDPDFDLINRAGQPSFVPADLTSCRGCKNLVGAEVVNREIGYPIDLCRGTGKLVFRPQSECRGCPMAEAGPMSTTTTGLEIRTEYREGYRVPATFAVSKVTSHGNTQAEPSEYQSDAPVDDEDRKQGIRAWRKITDPHGSGNVVFLPVFDKQSDVFTDKERELIPQSGDDTHPELYVDYAGLLYSFAVDGYMLKETLCLQGMPGVGKTEAARWFAWLMQLPFTRMTFTGESEVEDFIGSPAYDPERGTYFELGRIPLAYGRPGVTVYDEINLAPTPIREFLRPTFDNSAQLVVEAAKPAVTVGHHPFNFSVIAMNPSHDFRNVGTTEMASAEYDRLSPILVGLPPEPVERHIVMERCKLDGYEIPATTLDLIMAISEDIREMSDQGTVPFTWGVRQTIKVARKTRWYNLTDAFKRAALDFYEKSTAELVLQTISDRTA